MRIILTDLGKQLLADGVFTNEIPKITNVKFGDGGGVELVPVSTMTSLVNMTHVGLGNNTIKLSNPDRYYIHSYIPYNIGDITIRELGLYDDNDNLLAIGGEFERYKPSTDVSIEKMDFYITVPELLTDDLTLTFVNNSMFISSDLLDGINSDVEEQYIESETVSSIVMNLEPQLIAKPVITEPTSGVIDYSGPFVSSDYVALNGYTGLLTSLIWEISTDSAFTVIQEQQTYSTIQPFIPLNLIPLTTYYVRLRHISGVDLSDWSNTIIFTTPDIDLSGDGLNVLLAGDNINGGFYGELDITKLVLTRDYRGSYRTATLYKANQQVSHSNTLWNALVDVTSVVPGTDATKWEEDTREGLPTGQWLLDVCGVGYGLTDSNNDGYSSGSTAIGGLINNDQGWLKIVKNNKVLYVAKKPFVSTIAWNDLAKRSLVYGDRTVRIGPKLYWIRLLKDDEYLNGLVKLTDGTLGSYTATDLSLTSKTWIHDTQVGTVRKAYSNASTLESIHPGSRVGSYRPVLELIPAGSEPYNNLPNCPLATNENFQYDMYTDTGYFGVTPASSLLTGSVLATTIGLTSGTVQNDTEGYLKFYWHGKIIYMAKKTFRHTASWDNIKARNAIFGVDLGGVGKTTVSKDTYTFTVAIPTGAGKAPQSDIQYWTSPTFAGNVLLEIGKFSMWNELMYRVHNTFVDNVLSNQDGTTSNYEYTGGVQIGDNWANFINADLSIYYNDSGNGTATWCQETSSITPTSRVGRGYIRLASSNRNVATGTNTYVGWRPLLILN